MGCCRRLRCSVLLMVGIFARSPESQVSHQGSTIKGSKIPDKADLTDFNEGMSRDSFGILQRDSWFVNMGNPTSQATSQGSFAFYPNGPRLPHPPRVLARLLLCMGQQFAGGRQRESAPQVQSKVFLQGPFKSPIWPNQENHGFAPKICVSFSAPTATLWEAAHCLCCVFKGKPLPRGTNVVHKGRVCLALWECRGSLVSRIGGECCRLQTNQLVFPLQSLADMVFHVILQWRNWVKSTPIIPYHYQCTDAAQKT